MVNSYVYCFARREGGLNCVVFFIYTIYLSLHIRIDIKNKIILFTRDIALPYLFSRFSFTKLSNYKHILSHSHTLSIGSHHNNIHTYKKYIEVNDSLKLVFWMSRKKKTRFSLATNFLQLKTSRYCIAIILYTNTQRWVQLYRRLYWWWWVGSCNAVLYLYLMLWDD